MALPAPSSRDELLCVNRGIAVANAGVDWLVKT